MELSILADKFKSIAQRTWKIDRSDIHGNGVFALKYFHIGETIGLALKNEGEGVFVRTLLAHHINHQPKSNIVLKLIGDDYYFVASDNIYPDEEFVTNYIGYEQQMGRRDVKAVL